MLQAAASDTASFFACRTAFLEIGKEISAFSDQEAARNGLLQRMFAFTGYIADADFSLTGAIAVLNFGINFSAPNNSLRIHNKLVVKEKNCEDWRDRMRAAGCMI